MGCTLTISYNTIETFPEGTYGNGRVRVLTIDTKELADKRDALIPKLAIEGMTLSGMDVQEAFVYLGNWDSDEDPRIRAFMLGVRFAERLIADPERITIVGCGCYVERKRGAARSLGHPFIESECGGRRTLQRVIEQALATVAPDPSPVRTIQLEREFRAESVEEGFFRSRNRFAAFASLGKTLVAGRSDGQVFWRKRGRWTPTALKLTQGVNLLEAIEGAVYAGDGNCCSGATWRLSATNVATQLLPVHADEDPATRDGANLKSFTVSFKDGEAKTQDLDLGSEPPPERSLDLKGNVYGIAAFGSELLAGGGGCDGTHLYRMSADGMWEFHPDDPRKYIIRMMTSEDGIVVIAFLDGEIALYDGHVRMVGRVPETPYGLGEHEGTLFIGSTNSGHMAPASFSRGAITRYDGTQFVTEWSGTGGVHGFFHLDGVFYAWGRNQSNWSTSILRRDADGSWTLVARTPMSLELFVHDGVLYAGGHEEPTDGAQGDDAATIWRVTNLA